jgi:hypothetical protein
MGAGKKVPGQAMAGKYSSAVNALKSQDASKTGAQPQPTALDKLAS